MPPLSTTRRRTLQGLAVLAAGIAAGRARAASAGWPLWVVSTPGTVYLTGETPGLHTDWSDARIEALVPGCDALWTEAGSAARAPIGPLIVRYGYDAKTPLLTLLSEGDKDRLGKAAALAQLPVAQLGSVRPWLAAYELEHAYAHVTGNTAMSANQVLGADAKKAGVAIRSEFPAQDDTIAAYGAMSPLADLEFLRFTLDDILDPPGDIDRENAAWARGDLGPATAKVATARRRYPEFYRELLVERNRRWAPRIADMLQQSKPSLVVVGNYHLLGPDGVLAQLRRAGLTARRET
jgi:uncharacterized protein YbaP (TraB family)